MKKLLIGLFVAFVLLFIVSKVVSTPYYVVRVIDGDTVELNTGDIVRYISVDTPERNEQGWLEAGMRNLELVLNKRVELIKGDRDKDIYDRLLRDLIVDNKNISLILIDEGLARDI